MILEVNVDVRFMGKDPIVSSGSHVIPAQMTKSWFCGRTEAPKFTVHFGRWQDESPNADSNVPHGGSNRESRVQLLKGKK